MSKAIPATGPVHSLGAMSGTSLDGVDAAVIQTDGINIAEFGPADYRPYDAAEAAQLRVALGLWEGPEVTAAAGVVEAAHLDLLSRFEDVDLIGFHGQTLAHAPRLKGTLQVGNGARLAQQLRLPVVWDFRSNDVAMGGEGAPLAPFFHFACARWLGASAPVGFLNLGGVGNLTYVNPALDKPEDPGALLAFDTGPANAPINDLLMARRGVAMDKDGALARQGHVDSRVLEQFLETAYFSRMPPKSLDRNDFRMTLDLVSGFSDRDAAATLTACCAASVAQSMMHCPRPPDRILVTGGGRRNPVLMEMLQAALDCPVQPVEAVGLDGDMLEAQAFAFLAVRVARGLPTSCPGTTGVAAAIGGGTISYPETQHSPA